MKKLHQELPKWFTAEVYTEGGTAVNLVTGKKIELNNLELSMYDFIMSLRYSMEIGMWSKSMEVETIKDVQETEPISILINIDGQEIE